MTLQFHQADDVKVSLMEVRFYVPPSDVDGDAVEVSISSFRRNLHCNLFLQSIGFPSKCHERCCGINSQSRRCHLQFIRYQLSCSTVNDREKLIVFEIESSSGRHELRFYPGFFDLHGKSYDYKIPYNQITRGFLLPHKDNRQMYFVVIRNDQGNVLIQSLVFFSPSLLA